MKNLLLISCLVLTAGITWSQKAPRIASLDELIGTEKPALNIEHLKDEGITIWSNDFSDDTTWILDNMGQQGVEYGWNINAVSDGWFSANGINSTSGGNYAELVNGDPAPTVASQALDVVYTMTTAYPIDITSLAGTNEITLEFEQYGARFNDLQQILYSTDGVTFTPVGDNNDIPVLSASGGAAYDNPDLKQINLAPILEANSAPIWIQFSWTTNFPNVADNPNVWIAYGWYIDDVRLVTNPGNDLEITETYWGTEGLNYYQIPLTQVAPIDFEVAVFNGGANTQTNVTLNADINGGAFVGSSDPAEIISLDTAILTLSTPFTPDANGNYTIVQTISSDSTDDVPGNNEIDDISFAVNDFIYARDNSSPGGSTTNGVDGFESGNLFDIWADQTLKAIDVRIPGGTNGAQLGTEFYVKLYSLDVTTGDFIYEMESDVLTLTQQMQNTSLTVPLLSPVNVIANTTYLAVIGSFGEGLRVSTAGTSEPQTSFFLDLADNTWYYQTGTPYVRLNFDPTIGIEENNTAFSVGNIVPNPISGEGTLNVFMNNAKNMSMNILDVSGKLVGSESKNLHQGENKIYLDTKQLSSGIYTVTLSSGTTSFSRKMIVQ
jgi:hypothetical protein